MWMWLVFVGCILLIGVLGYAAIFAYLFLKDVRKYGAPLRL